MNSLPALEAAAAAGADWVGFVFAPSPRRVTPVEAARLSAAVPGGPRRVGLFVAPEEAEIAAVLDVLPLDVLQLYVDAPRTAALRARFGLPVWRSVRSDALPDALEGADALVAEPPPPPGAGRAGGHGAAFDYAALAAWRPGFPWLLAGGLTPENVAGAVAASGAPAVDVSSGVERAPGVKDPALIRAFVAAARGAPGRGSAV